MLTAWKKMKDREAFIIEELRLFGSSEILEMLGGGYNARISYDQNAGVVKYSSESCLPCREKVVQFSLEARQMGWQTAAKTDGKKGPPLELLVSSSGGKEIRVSSARRPKKEIIARTSVEFPYNLNLSTAYLLYRLADLYEMDDLGNLPIGLTPEQLKEYLKGYLSEESEDTADDDDANADSGGKSQDTDIPKPFRKALEDMEL